MKRKKGIIAGVGINDIGVSTGIIDGKRVLNPYYKVWHAMVNRCYNEKYHARQPTYKGCTVCEDWLYFSKFKNWIEQQDWEGKQLDKDLLVGGNKVYSPNTCLFVSREINSSLTLHGGKRGTYPVGVNYHKRDKRHSSQISVKGAQKTLGRFKSPREAHIKWQLAKIDAINGLKDSQPDFLVKIGLQRVIDKIQDDYDNHRETIDLN